jgi:hypothetical protein
MAFRELCTTGEKWFASGESKIFRLGTDLKSVPISEKDFEPRRSHFSKVSFQRYQKGFKRLIFRVL